MTNIDDRWLEQREQIARVAARLGTWALRGCVVVDATGFAFLDCCDPRTAYAVVDAHNAQPMLIAEVRRLRSELVRTKAERDAVVMAARALEATSDPLDPGTSGPIPIAPSEVLDGFADAADALLADWSPVRTEDEEGGVDVPTVRRAGRLIQALRAVREIASSAIEAYFFAGQGSSVEGASNVRDHLTERERLLSRAVDRIQTTAREAIANAHPLE